MSDEFREDTFNPYYVDPDAPNRRKSSEALGPTRVSDEYRRGSYNPFENRDVAKPITSYAALGGVLKGCVGTGVLGMPKSYNYSGLWCGLISTIVIGLFVTYGMYILVVSAHVLYFRHQIPSMHYDEVGEVAFLNGPTEKIRKKSKLIKHSINFMIITFLLGCCTVYVAFVARNLKQVVDGYSERHLSVRMYILILLPFFLIYVTIRSLKILTALAIMANILIVIGLGITIYFCFSNTPPISERPFFGPPEDFALFFGIVIFALDGIGLIMPLENHMKNPEKLVRKPAIICIAMGITIFLFSFIGFVGCWKYGDEIMDSVTLNVPEHEIAGQIVEILFAIAIFQTFGLQFYVPFHIIWRHQNDKNEFMVRFAITIAICVAAFLVPSIAQIMALVGSFCLACLGMIFPGIIHLVTFYEEPGYGTGQWRLIMDIILIIIGVLGFFTGTVTGITDIIRHFNKDL